MAVLVGAVGPSNVQRSRNVDAEETRNWYMETAGAGTPKVQWSLQPVPAVKVFCRVGTGPVRALFAQDGRAFAVSGTSFSELFASGTSTVRGTVSEDSRPATISSNGKAGEQLFITSDMRGYIFDLLTNTFAQIDHTVVTAFPSNAASGLFFDGYFIVLDGITGQFGFSSLEDGTEWNGLDIGAVSQFSDKVIAMTRTHDNLMLFGTKNTQAWNNVGAAAFPFQPVPGGIIEHGIAAEFSAVELDNTLYYLGKDEHGDGAVWKLNGYTPVEVSTQAIRWELSKATSLAPAVAWAYQFERHIFYVLHVPSLDSLLVYDVATEQWHKWSLWSETFMRWFAHIGRCHAFGFDRHLIGDRQSGTIYTFNLTGDEAGVDRVIWTGPV